jgi:hypothetical protein
VIRLRLTHVTGWVTSPLGHYAIEFCVARTDPWLSSIVEYPTRAQTQRNRLTVNVMLAQDTPLHIINTKTQRSALGSFFKENDEKVKSVLRGLGSGNNNGGSLAATH